VQRPDNATGAVVEGCLALTRLILAVAVSVQGVQGPILIFGEARLSFRTNLFDHRQNLALVPRDGAQWLMSSGVVQHDLASLVGDVELPRPLLSSGRCAIGCASARPNDSVQPTAEAGEARCSGPAATDG